MRATVELQIANTGHGPTMGPLQQGLQGGRDYGCVPMDPG